jgi:hypothetical protein
LEVGGKRAFPLAGVGDDGGVGGGGAIGNLSANDENNGGGVGGNIDDSAGGGDSAVFEYGIGVVIVDIDTTILVLV